MPLFSVLMSSYLVFIWHFAYFVWLFFVLLAAFMELPQSAFLSHVDRAIKDKKKKAFPSLLRPFVGCILLYIAWLSA